MKNIIIRVLLTFAVILPVQALQLVNFHNPDCPHCMQFMSEIGKAKFDVDPRAAAKDITMVVLDFSKPPPQWILGVYGRNNQIKPIPGTPTFVLWDETKQQELGRFSGYGSADRFWIEFNKLLK